MKWKHLKLEEKGNIAVITINKPETMNSMNLAFLYDMQEAIDLCEKNMDMRCAILTGAGEKAFSAGGDVVEEKNFTSDMVKEYNAQGGVIIRMIMNSRMPYIAAVNGYALGAAVGLITACDISIAADHAIFGIPTPSLGGIPGWGCTQVTARVIGAQHAKMLLLANEKYNAEEALRVGLINKIVRRDALLTEAMKYAERIAAFAPNAMQSTKYAVNRGLESSLEEGFEIEAGMLDRCNTDVNFKEGITAFLEKRPAKFRML
jgi:enoyl-CoA hydratase